MPNRPVASRREQGGRRLLLALGLTLVIMFAEILGGLLSGSLALLTDAAHMLVDVIALAIGYFAIAVSRRPPDAKRTYGYRRAEILAALANGILLVGLLILIVGKAAMRVSHPQPIAAGMMTAVACVGLIANGVSLLLLSRHRHTTQNLRASFLHVLSDTLSSVGVLAAGVIIGVTGWTLADPLVSFFIAALILRQVWLLLRDAINVLLEATPSHLVLEHVRAEIAAVNGVLGVHDLHITTHASDDFVLTAHIVLDDQQPFTVALGIVADIRRMLREHYHIGHATIETDSVRTAAGVHNHCPCEFPPES